MKIQCGPVAACLFLAMVSTNSAVASNPPPPRSVTEVCEENYRQSSANSTCENESFSEKQYGNCKIAANCKESEYVNVFTTITLNPDVASRLVNCTGRLKLDNC